MVINGKEMDLYKSTIIIDRSIVKTFYGDYIDLSKLISISDAKFINKMGYGGYYVGFNMEFQLMENLIEYIVELSYEDYVKIKDVKTIYNYNGEGLETMELLKCKIEQLVDIWINV